MTSFFGLLNAFFTWVVFSFQQAQDNVRVISDYKWLVGQLKVSRLLQSHLLISDAVTTNITANLSTKLKIPQSLISDF